MKTAEALDFANTVDMAYQGCREYVQEQGRTLS